MRGAASNARALAVAAAVLAAAAISPAGARGARAPAPAGSPPAGMRVAILPFGAPGIPSDAWEAAMAELQSAAPRWGVVPVDRGRIEEALRERRLRDMATLSREDLLQLSSALGADAFLIGHVYRMDPDPNPAVSLAASLVEPGSGRVLRMGVALVEGRSFLGPLGGGGPVSIERTLARAVDEVLEGIAGDDSSAGRRAQELLKDSMLAPASAQYLAKGLRFPVTTRIIVLPFRNETSSRGAGWSIADLAEWCFSSTGAAEILDSGAAARALLARGWRTGIPVGREAILALGSDLGADAVLMGSVQIWDEGHPASGVPPRVAFSARLLDARTGDILWAANHDRLGDETRILYDIGNVRLVEALAARSSFEALRPLLDVFEGVRVARGSGGRQ